MAAPRILVSREVTPRAREIAPPDAGQPWTILGWIGIAFALIGAVDIALAWLPSAFGSPEWEFATIGASLNGLPLPALGLVMFMAAGLAQRRRWQILTAAGALTLLGVLVVFAAFLYLTVVPLALREVENELARTGLLKSIVKASALLVLYPVVLGAAGMHGWKRSTQW